MSKGTLRGKKAALEYWLCRPVRSLLFFVLKISMTDGRIEKIKHLRMFLLSRIEGLTTEQLNTIPVGFNNNIVWNLAHLVAAQQSICYLRAGVPPVVAETYITDYLPGTKPRQPIDGETIATIKELLISSIDTMGTDYARHLFRNYTYSERIKEIYGIDVRTIDDAIDFILYHEGFHIGCVLMLKHLV